MPTVLARHQTFVTTNMVVVAMQAHCLYMRHLTFAHLLSATFGGDEIGADIAGAAHRPR